MKKPFDKELLSVSGGMHLNGGRAFNTNSWTIEYEGKTIGAMVRGRRGKDSICVLSLGSDEFDLVALKRTPIDVIEEYINKQD